MLLAGCSTLPRGITEDSLLDDAQARQIQMESSAARMVETMAMRMLHKATAVPPGDPVNIDVLALSGGGEYGAFGAGFLDGWGTLGDGQLARPDFDMVTGISTGALIAPFAYLGSETSYTAVRGLYDEATKEFAVLRGLFFFLPRNPNFFDNSEMARTLRETVDAPMLDQVTEAYAEHKLLLIGTTDIDLGQFVVWDLGHEIATHPEPEHRFEEVLLASSAIPAVFPPIFIDGHLHVDGGATEQMFFATDFRVIEASVARARQLGLGDHRVNFRFWVIVNNTVGLEPEVIPQSWFRIAERSLSMLMKASALSALQRGQQVSDILNARNNGITSEFRYVSIPHGIELPDSRSLFNPDLMQQLTALGYKLGADRSCWRTEAPLYSRQVYAD
jgi:hypothetical protein